MKQSQMVHAVKQYDTFIENFYLCFVDYYAAQSEWPYATHSNNTRFLHENPNEVLSNLRDKKKDIENVYTGRSEHLHLLIKSIEWFIKLRDLPAEGARFDESPRSAASDRSESDDDSLSQKWRRIEQELKIVYGLFHRLFFEKKDKVLKFEFACEEFHLTGLAKSNMMGGSTISRLGEIMFERIFKTIQPDIVRPEQIDLDKINVFIEKACHLYKEVEMNDMGLVIHELKELVRDQASRIERLEKQVAELKAKEMGRLLFPFGTAALATTSGFNHGILYSALRNSASKESLSSTGASTSSAMLRSVHKP